MRFNNNLKTNIHVLYRSMLSRMLGVHKAVSASWSITARCNLKCGHCGVFFDDCYEMNTCESLRIVELLSDIGVGWVFISGGEPLLRDDLSIIIQALKSRNVRVGLSTNGLLLSERIHSLKNLDKVYFSFDGPEKFHDSLRGKGAYESLMKSIEAAKKYNIKMHLTCVLLKDNLEHIDFILDKAEELRLPLSVQPGRLNRLGADKKNNYAPIVEDYKKTIDYLIKRKKSGYKWLFNTISGLRHLRSWPHSVCLPCVAGKLHFYITPSGHMRSCRNYPIYENNSQNEFCGIIKSEYRKVKPANCDKCWCGEIVEFNKAYNLEIPSVVTLLKGNIS